LKFSVETTLLLIRFLQELKRSVDKANLDVVEHIAAESLRIHEAYKASLPDASTSDSAMEQAAGP